MRIVSLPLNENPSFHRLPGSLSLGAGTRSRIVELVRRAESAHAADGSSALLNGEESAIQCTARVAAVNGAPWIGIIWRIIGKGSRRSEDEGREGQGCRSHGRGLLRFVG